MGVGRQRRSVPGRMSIGFCDRRHQNAKFNGQSRCATVWQRRMSVERTLSRLNLNLLITALLIAAVGCMLVYSATYSSPESAPLFRKQIIWTSIGLLLMLLFI